MGVLNNPLQFVSPSVVVYRDYGALNECMRPGYVGNLFDFLNAQYPQIGMPSVVSEYWIMICTDPSRWTVSGLNLIKKAAYRYCVYVISMSCKADDASGMDVDGQHYPVGSEMPECRTNRFTSVQVDRSGAPAPETIFGLA
jgi:hypothetical protein